MTFGSHSHLVFDVLEFAKTGNLLQPIGIVEDTLCVVVASLEEAKVSAWQTPYGREEYLWTDIREQEMSKVNERTYSRPDFAEIRNNLMKEIGGLSIAVKKRLDGRHRELLDDIVSDLYNCAYNRVVNGTADGFFERMFSIYLFGAWPCGWSGDYPEGKFVAYVPSTR